MQKVYIPQAVKDGLFTGSVTMKLLTYDERMDVSEAAAEGKGNAAVLRKMAAMCKNKWVTVALKRVSDKQEFKSFEDMQYGPDCHDIINDVLGWMLTGDKKQTGETSAP